MSFAIIRGANGRRHEVDFGEDPIEVSVSMTETVVEIYAEATDDACPPDKRQFVLLNIPRDQFASALGQGTRRSKSMSDGFSLQPVRDDG